MEYEITSFSFKDKVEDHDRTAQEERDLLAHLRFAEFILAAVSHSAQRRDFTIDPFKLQKASGTDSLLPPKIEAARNAVQQAHVRLAEQLGDDAAAQDLGASVENGRLTGS